MGFKISLVSGQPSFEALPVAKITDYPLEKRDYKPFAQCRLCISEESFYIQMWAFEVNPSEQSSLKILLVSPDGKNGFSAQLWSTGKLEFKPFEDKAGLVPLALHPMWGEDLQGDFWGGTLELPIETANVLLGEHNLCKNGIIKGNIYKLSTDKEKPHMGSFYKADFANGRQFEKESLGEFEIVGY